MKIEFTGLRQQRQNLRNEIEKNISSVLDHGNFILGPEVLKFEEELSSYSKSCHAIGVANGTDALQICLMAIGVGAGDAVLVPSFTYTATAEVILILGAQPVFVEVDQVSFNIDTKDLVRALAVARSKGLNPKAIIGVDLFGLPADWLAINKFADENGMTAIADAAQSFGAVAENRSRVGVLAVMTTVSFFPAKPLGCYGDGGAILTQDNSLAEVIKSIRTHGQGAQKYETIRVGMNSRLDTIQAAILLAKIGVLDAEIEQRNRVAEKYTAGLNDVVLTPSKPLGVVSAWAQYTIRTNNRTNLQRNLADVGIPTAVYYPSPMHLQPAYAAYGDGEGSLIVSEQLSREVLSLPMNPYATDEELDFIIEAVRKAL